MQLGKAGSFIEQPRNITASLLPAFPGSYTKENVFWFSAEVQWGGNWNARARKLDTAHISASPIADTKWSFRETVCKTQPDHTAQPFHCTHLRLFFCIDILATYRQAPVQLLRPKTLWLPSPTFSAFQGSLGEHPGPQPWTYGGFFSHNERRAENAHLRGVAGGNQTFGKSATGSGYRSPDFSQDKKSSASHRWCNQSRSFTAYPAHSNALLTFRCITYRHVDSQAPSFVRFQGLVDGGLADTAPSDGAFPHFGGGGRIAGSETERVEILKPICSSG